MSEHIDLLDRLADSQKACFDRGLHIAAMDIQSAREFIAKGLSHPAPAASPCGKMRAALEFIRDGYERGDISHVDYRVGAYMAALDALGDATSSDEGGEALATARDPQAPATVLPDPLNGSDAGHEASEAPAGLSSDDECVRKEAGVAPGSSEAITEILRRTFGADDVVAKGCAARIVEVQQSAATAAGLVVELSEDDPTVLSVAHSIAEHGFARPWDDFLPLNVHDTDQSDLIDYAKAAIAAMPSLPTREAVAQAIYEVSVRWIEPGLGMKMVPFKDLGERDMRLHLEYADAVLSIPRNDGNTGGPRS